MPSGKSLSEDLRKRIVREYQAGTKQSIIARQFHVSRQVVYALLKRFNTRGVLCDKKKSGRPRKTTPRLDRTIIRIVTEDPFKSSNQVKAVLEAQGLENISARSIRRRLVDAKLFSRRPAKKPLLSAKNRLARLEFAKAHLHWGMEEWKRVCFSDESKYNLFNSDGIRYVRRPPGHRMDPKFTKPTVKHGGGSVIVWGCFSGFGGMGPLHRIHGIMDRLVYKDIIQNIMLPYVEEKMPLLFTFQQDNDPKHRSRVVQDFFIKEKINVMKWPSQSPDLNPIENLWEHLERLIRYKTYKNQDELFQSLEENWHNISEEVINKLLESMPRRCRAVIDNKGYFTKY